ncbi:MAG: cytochrome c oxidase assembly protein [Firmicutes bacterium]|nr:cytochrome c oxidase assembly protein [Alicyclobacillaceae bacterium]MCL6496497.1 cytochrome c oxidase assembly protein [Bacillota bacterium]
MIPLNAIPFWAWATPGILVAVAAVAALYLWILAGPGHALVPHLSPPTRLQAAAFLAGCLFLYLALGSPLGVLAMGYSFTAHMIQHVLAALVAAPLLLVGLPADVWRSVLRTPGLGFLFRRAVRPIPALVVFNLFFGILVWPPLLDAMVRSMALMLTMHLILVVVAIPMWWPLLSPLPELPRLHPGVQLLYIFADGLPMLLPLALVALDTHPLYAAAYQAGVRAIGMGLVPDQQLGGSICIVLVHALYGALFIVRFRQWARLESGRIDGVPHLSVVEPPAKRR